MADKDKKKEGGTPTAEVIAVKAKEVGLKIGKLIITLIVIMVVITWAKGRMQKYEKLHPEVAKPAPTATTVAGQDYDAFYDFSQITGPAASRKFTVPKGSKGAYLVLPLNYRPTFSSETAIVGELDKLDGSKPIKFGEQVKGGYMPAAIAIRSPEGCEMVASFGYVPPKQEKRAEKEKQVSFFGEKSRAEQKKQKPAHEVLPDPNAPPKGPQYLGS